MTTRGRLRGTDDDVYDIILADPPTRFETRSDRGKGRSPERHYPVMSTEALCRLPVAGLAADNAALFYWTTRPLLLGAPGSLSAPQQVIEAWGFRYATVAWTWVKTQRSGAGLHMGLGYYTRANAEFCLLAVRGRMPVAAHDVLDVILAPVREHSRKPDAQYALIDRLYPNTRRLELFARRRWPGWDVWGNEIACDVVLEAGAVQEELGL